MKNMTWDWQQQLQASESARLWHGLALREHLDRLLQLRTDFMLITRPCKKEDEEDIRQLVEACVGCVVANPALFPDFGDFPPNTLIFTDYAFVTRLERRWIVYTFYDASARAAVRQLHLARYGRFDFGSLYDMEGYAVGVSRFYRRACRCLWDLEKLGGTGVRLSPEADCGRRLDQKI